MSKTTQLITYWIIVNEKKNSIWDKPFLDESSCQAVWKQNMKQFQSNGWKIETRTAFREVDEGEASLNRLVDKARRI